MDFVGNEVKRRLTELDAADSMPEEGHLEIAILLTWSEFKEKRKQFKKEVVKKTIQASAVFEDLCERMFENVWNQVIKFFQSISNPPQVKPVPIHTGYEAFTG